MNCPIIIHPVSSFKSEFKKFIFIASFKAYNYSIANIMKLDISRTIFLVKNSLDSIKLVLKTLIIRIKLGKDIIAI